MVIDSDSGRDITKLDSYKDNYRFKTRYSLLGEMQNLFIFIPFCLQILIIIWNTMFSGMDLYSGIMKSLLPVLILSVAYVPVLGKKILYLCDDGFVVESYILGMDAGKMVRLWTDLEGWKYRRIKDKLRLTRGWGHEKTMLFDGDKSSIDFIVRKIRKKAIKV